MRIAIEGIDGSGKSTLIKNIQQIAETPELVQIISKKEQRPIRNIYKALMSQDRFISPELSLLLGLSDYLFAEEYLEDISKDYHIYDRSFISTLVDCQSLGLSLESDIERIAKLFPYYDLVVYIDADAQLCCTRKAGLISRAEAGGAAEQVENGFLEFQSKNTVNYKRFLKVFADNGIIGDLFILPADLNPISSAKMVLNHFN